VANTIIVARHGESTYSREGLINGDPTVSCPLTETGRAQAARLGQDLMHTRIDLCYTSQFERARETARIALEIRPVPVSEHAGLNDPKAGCLESGALIEYLEWHSRAGWEEAPPGGGESQSAVVHRYAQAWADMASLAARSVLVVCHALPTSFVLAITDERGPAVRRRYSVEVAYAKPYVLEGAQIRRGLERVSRELSDFDG
jgi:broad specificity phosphatase PhoE